MFLSDSCTGIIKRHGYETDKNLGGGTGHVADPRPGLCPDDASGKATRELVYNERNKLYEVKKFEYNEFGKKKTQYLYDANGKLQTVKVYEYLTEDA